MKTILSVNKVTKQYRSNELILKEVSLEIEEGSFTVIIGPSGSGKSTLLNIMSGLQKPSRGSVFSETVTLPDLMNMSLQISADWISVKFSSNICCCHISPRKRTSGLGCLDRVERFLCKSWQNC